jgi:hypothetical protein
MNIIKRLLVIIVFIIILSALFTAGMLVTPLLVFYGIKWVVTGKDSCDNAFIPIFWIGDNWHRVIDKIY